MEEKDKYQQALNDIINNCKDFKVKNDSFWLIQNAIEKVEQLKKENEELKSAQNKLAVQKLEKVLHWIKLDSHKYGEDEDDWYSGLSKYIKTMLADLKGEEKYEN